MNSTTRTPPVSPEGLREHRKRDTRTAIHAAALRLVTDRGFDATTVEEISAAAGISPRTFFNYFPSKASAVLGVILQPLTKADRSGFVTSNGDLLADLCDLVSRQISAPADITALASLTAQQLGLLGEIGGQLGAMRHDLVDLTRRRTGEDRTANLAVSLVTAAFGATIRTGTPTATQEELSAQLQGTVQELGAIARRAVLDQASSPREIRKARSPE